ncbi:amino acid racemase [Vallitalea pronyensis]|uniref:Amino acid racemase n=1 Tax=Vallitalea pronyensis TaxID=1348613 RepID=A0A8J8MHN4_9FIRM|nr:amino acid racemase [Vallitalea pronyensis]QUI21825.1 amino acid racemase [Vallitalea pronyensis]
MNNQNSHISIGILAGMGPRSTTPFLELVLDQCQIQYGAKDDIDYPHMVVYALPTPYYVDRVNDDRALGQSIIEGTKRLASFGVDYIAIPCNTAHKYYNDIQKNVHTKVLNIIDVTLKNIPKHGKVTVLATETTMETYLYQKGILENGGQYKFVHSWQKQVNAIIAMCKDAEDKNKRLQCWQQLMKDIQEEGVRHVVVACTDLTMLIEENSTLNYIDSSMALAEAVVQEYVKRKKIKQK